MRGNSVSVVGNITRDVEVRTIQSGRSIANFGIAWNKSRKRQDGQGYEDIPNYFDCKAWLTEAQRQWVEPTLRKGAKVALVDAHLEYESWEDQNGQKRSKVVVMVDDPMNGIVVKSANKPQPAPAPAPQASVPQTPVQPQVAYTQQPTGNTVQQAVANAVPVAPADAYSDSDTPF